ncbi:MAG: hypothetical protein V2B19_02785 [Pseudomonadota bacterium]
MDRQKALFHIAWGCILTMFGVAVFFRVPQVMPQIERIESFSSVLGFIRFCFYLLGALLIGGGAKKIIENYRRLEKK